MTDSVFLVRVAVPVPLRRYFDYLPPAELSDEAAGQILQAGVRVRVPFGSRKLVGVVVETECIATPPAHRLRPILEVLDQEPVLTPDSLSLLTWASQYYQHPVGEVMQHALPALLRQGRPAAHSMIETWRLTQAGLEIDPEDIGRRAPRQAALLDDLRVAGNTGRDAAWLGAHHDPWRDAMRRLVDKGWVEVQQHRIQDGKTGTHRSGPELNEEQAMAVQAVEKNLHHYQAFLLDGITGSGKTEVYLSLIETCLRENQQALILVPEIGLTPQLLQRFRDRLEGRLIALHSGLSDQERLQGWLAAREGEADIVVGTRSAVFTPLARPGLFIVDEEHDGSYKQQDGFRYSARDLAMLRAQRAGVPVILGSATPSLESLHAVNQQRCIRLQLHRRAGDAQPPTFKVLDVRRKPMDCSLSADMQNSIRQHLDANRQVLLFLNRRGFAPTLMCHACGWTAHCERCDSHMTQHFLDRRLRCHHCGAERRLPDQCPSCGEAELISIGQGTERLESQLTELFPSAEVVRVDRDSTRRKGELHRLLDKVKHGQNQILVGTQMLAKGHHFPNVTLVGIIDADQGLYSADFRGPERMAQTIIQVAGRAGRAEHPGQVIVQTHNPDNPLLMSLIRDGYHAFAEMLAEERQQAELPPYTYLALLRAEATNRGAPMNFLLEARQCAQGLGLGEVEILGPLPAPMEKRAGRFRAQLLLQSHQRAPLQALLTPWLRALEELRSARDIRWSIDVDPQETF